MILGRSYHSIKTLSRDIKNYAKCFRSILITSRWSGKTESVIRVFKETGELK